MNKMNGVILGVLTGSLIASAYALFGNQRIVNKLRNQSYEWASRAKNAKENVFENVLGLTESRKSRNRKNFVGGAVLGLLIGVGTAALLTPKSGKQLRKNLTQTYEDMADKTNEVLNFISHNEYRRPLKKLSRFLIKRRHVRSRAKN